MMTSEKKRQEYQMLRFHSQMMKTAVPTVFATYGYVLKIVYCTPKGYSSYGDLALKYSVDWEEAMSVFYSPSRKMNPT